MLSDGTVDLARSEAACAYGCFSYSAVVIDPYSLDVSIPFSSCMDIRVRNRIARSLTFAAYFTFSGHLPHLLYSLISNTRFRTPDYYTQSISIMQGLFLPFSLLIFQCFDDF